MQWYLSSHFQGGYLFQHLFKSYFTFWPISNRVCTKVKSAILSLSKGSKVFCSASNKEKSFPENFSKNSNLDDPGIFLPAFSL